MAVARARLFAFPSFLQRTPCYPFFWSLFLRCLDARRRTPPLTEDVLDTILEDVPGPKAAGNVQPLLPALMFSTFPLVELLQASVVLERIILVVKVKIDTRTVKDSSRHLAPSALPVVGPGPVPCPTHARLCAREEV